MPEIRYVCLDGCNMMVTVKEFKAGKNTCTKKNCSRSGKPLLRSEYCARCNTSFEEGEDHVCI